MCEVVRVVGLFTSPGEEGNKPTKRNTRDANDFAHAKTLARKKTSAGRAAES